MSVVWEKLDSFDEEEEIITRHRVEAGQYELLLSE